MDWSWLLVLICPLMMVFMMFGMKGTHGRSHGHHPQGDSSLREELNELKAQNEQMKQEIQKLSR
ncbi:hypothetical protein [Fontibacillus sp. BL9]|uniref:hypothetical protein n=1 Tax=Fontibacillus sp. BL9 TaxID=3389971 RepID=UPI0039797100